MGKTTRKNLLKIRFSDFDDHYKRLYGDLERSLAKYGRGLSQDSQRDIRRMWARAGRDGQRDYHERLHNFDVAFDKKAAKTIARKGAKRAIKRAMKDDALEDLLTPTRRDEKARALADIYY
jgi:hypothetical protein